VFFAKILFENPVLLNMRFGMQPRSFTVAKVADIFTKRIWQPYYCMCAVCDVTPKHYIHVSKPVFWRSLLIQYTYYSSRTLLIRCCIT